MGNAPQVSPQQPRTIENIKFMIDKTYYRATLEILGNQAPADQQCLICGREITMPETKIEATAITITKATITKLENVTADMMLVELGSDEANEIQKHIDEVLLDPDKPIHVGIACLQKLGMLIDN